ncbi:MAG TPA: metallophosphoesterase [Opitutaceae bacterium]|nr:metallophosphoesterase [Opitutaceae bacterium]
MPPGPRPAVPPGWRIDRRDFLKASAAALFGLALGDRRRLSAEEPHPAGWRFGLVTDPHYADADPKGTLFYRESIGKMREAVGRLQAERVAFLAELGDFKDMAPGEPEERTLSHLVTIEREFQRFGGPAYHVLGNHDMDNLSKAQVLAHIANTGIPASRSYYAFGHGGVRFVTVDTNFMHDGRDYDHGNFDWRDIHLPPAELEWLRAELSAATEPVIIFGHQRFDGDGHVQVVNRAQVREVFESSGKVLAVFQGHDHKGAYSLINGIHYYTLRAVVEGSGAENNAYAVVDVHRDLALTVTGYRRAVSMELAHNG